MNTLPSKNPRPLLIWDVDDVLNELMCFWLDGGLPKSVRRLPFSSLTENPPDELLGLSRREYLESLDAYRAGPHYRQAPRKEILAFFQKHGVCFRHIVLSSVPMRFAGRSADWVLSHFGQWIQNCLFVPSPRPDFKMESQFFSSKAEALALLEKEAVLIDDSPLHVDEAGKTGASAFLFPAPWNENRSLSISVFLDRIAQLNPGE